MKRNLFLKNKIKFKPLPVIKLSEADFEKMKKLDEERLRIAGVCSWMWSKHYSFVKKK